MLAEVRNDAPADVNEVRFGGGIIGVDSGAESVKLSSEALCLGVCS